MGRVEPDTWGCEELPPGQKESAIEAAAAKAAANAQRVKEEAALRNYEAKRNAGRQRIAGLGMNAALAEATANPSTAAFANVPQDWLLGAWKQIMEDPIFRKGKQPIANIRARLYEKGAMNSSMYNLLPYTQEQWNAVYNIGEAKATKNMANAEERQRKEEEKIKEDQLRRLRLFAYSEIRNKINTYIWLLNDIQRKMKYLQNPATGAKSYIVAPKDQGFSISMLELTTDEKQKEYYGTDMYNAIKVLEKAAANTRTYNELQKDLASQFFPTKEIDTATSVNVLESIIHNALENINKLSTPLSESYDILYEGAKQDQKKFGRLFRALATEKSKKGAALSGGARTRRRRKTRRTRNKRSRPTRKESK
jgi:hypothetical protein